MFKKIISEFVASAAFLVWIAGTAPSLLAGVEAASFLPAKQPSVLVLYDGADVDRNPGRIDARYLGNLCGHFTTHRTIQSLSDYKPGQWKAFDAVFCIVYQKHYKVPEAFLRDVPDINRTFCWLGNQVGQLDQLHVLKEHGVAFDRFYQDSPFTSVKYKEHLLDKGDPDINLLVVKDASKADVVAEAISRARDKKVPYIIRSGSFWVVADSPFAYSSENDRYLVFADVLHDILGIDHKEDHRAMIRIEDLNALSNPADLAAVLAIFKKNNVPFSFGIVPVYVNPGERIYVRLSDKPQIVQALKKFVEAGGSPILHGYTHQRRGISTDDYEFWDDLADRPVLGDSERFASSRIEDSLKEAMEAGLYPLSWETPHYAGSIVDYKAVRRYFATTYERRLVANHLGSDQYFPYPVIDLYGQYVIPEDTSYVPKEDQTIQPLLENASSALVVRDGYASAFFHPFLNLALLDGLIKGFKERGYHFVDIRSFPNRVQMEGRLITTESGEIEVGGHGRYLVEQFILPGGKTRERIVDVPEEGLVKRLANLNEGEVYVAQRQETRPPSWIKKLLHVAKGDFSVIQNKWEDVFQGGSIHEPIKTVILWNSRAIGEEAKDQESFYVTLDNLSLNVERVDRRNFTEQEVGAFTLFVVPWSTARILKEEEVSKIIRMVNEGVVLVTDGPSPLAEALGIQLATPAPVQNLTNHLFVAQDTRWPDAPTVPWISRPSFDEATLYYSERDHERPLMIGGVIGEGRYLYMAPLYDPISGLGYARFPDLPFILYNEYRVRPMLKGYTAEAYFDPGYRQNISIERLAKMWRRSGIRTVHAAAWHFYDKYSYDYARLIRVAHQNGIAVYAWFEYPHVSQRFWNQHPEWREKSALLTDARVDWRYLMDLQNPDCQKAIMSDMRSFMEGLDWDGVNLAELTFDSPRGPERPEFFTPFGTTVRRDFKLAHGFDPVGLLDSHSDTFWKKNPAALNTFYEFRKKLNLRLMETFLKNFQEINRRRNHQWEVVVTMLDAHQVPSLSDSLGIDMDGTISLINRFNATLQVEDPASEWSKAPSRYAALGEHYKHVALRRPYVIDINVLPVHPANQKGYASSQPTGSEMMELWRVAADQTSRVCLYSESTIYEQDWEILPHAIAAKADVRKEGDEWIIDTPQTVTLDMGRGARTFLLDGQPWFCSDDGEVWIPPGEHRLVAKRPHHAWMDTTQLETRLLFISGELLGSQGVRRGLEVEYRSPNRCALMFNKMPLITFVDGKPYKITSIKGDDGYVILAPPGHHRVRIMSESALLYFLEFTSLVSASLIVLFGMVSSGLLAVLFIIIWIYRRTHRIRKAFPRSLKRGSKSKAQKVEG